MLGTNWGLDSSTALFKFVNMAELSPEEFRRNLFQAFRSRGVLEALKVTKKNEIYIMK